MPESNLLLWSAVIHRFFQWFEDVLMVLHFTECFRIIYENYAFLSSWTNIIIIIISRSFTYNNEEIDNSHGDETRRRGA